MKTLFIFVVAILIGLGTMSQSKPNRHIKPPNRSIKPKLHDFSKLKDTTKPVQKIVNNFKYYILTDTITNRKDTILIYSPDY